MLCRAVVRRDCQPQFGPFANQFCINGDIDGIGMLFEVQADFHGLGLNLNFRTAIEKELSLFDNAQAWEISRSWTNH